MTAMLPRPGAAADASSADADADPGWGAVLPSDKDKDGAGAHPGLAIAVAQAFEDGGPLAIADPRYVRREEQLLMATQVALAIERREALVAEAGTGVGKTFAYLVPALLSGARVLISTATKSLQDQLFLRDLPRLRNALNVPVMQALLKGRSSYLCLHRLGLSRQSSQVTDRFALRALSKVEEWSRRTVSGDLAELDGLDERSPIIPLVTSSRENCLGSECPDYRQCHVLKARREAMAADIVVVNHHLFFADMTLRDTGVAELLPSVDVAIFDEAHQLAEAGVAFLGTQLGSGQVIDFARDMLAVGLQQARGLAPWQDLAALVDRAARELRLAASGPMKEVRGSLKLRWEERASRPDFDSALHGVAAACKTAGDHLDMMSELSPDFDKLSERASALSHLGSLFSEPAAVGNVRWIDLSPHQARLVESPLDVRDALRQQMAIGHKAWIFTSATLGDDENLSWFSEAAGLEEATKLRVGSPFDYPANARLFIPAWFPKPSEPNHAGAVAQLAADCAARLGGRTFVLTTTLRALQAVGERMREIVEARGDDIEVLMQGTLPKRQLMQRFIDSPKAVLVGSQSFWEGIDVPGDALQCVLIDKLPFPPPNDPLVEARVKRLESQGRNPFADYFVAEAAISLKQGAGRLIRTESDRGLLVICDPRMAGMNYGRRLRQALPPMTRITTEEEAMEWLAELRAAPEG